METDVGCTYSVTELELDENVEILVRLVEVLVDWVLTVDPLLTEVSEDVLHVVEVWVEVLLDMVDWLVSVDVLEVWEVLLELLELCVVPDVWLETVDVLEVWVDILDIVVPEVTVLYVVVRLETLELCVVSVVELQVVDFVPVVVV